jgi:hypothetical protein
MESRPPTIAPQPPDESLIAPDPLTDSFLARARGITPIALLLVLLLAYFLIEIKAVLMLIIIAYLFGTIIERPVNSLQRRHIPRGLSILLIYIAIIGVIGVLVYLLAPTISNEADIFRREAPDQLRELQRNWRTSDNGILSGPGVDGLQNLIEAIQRPPDIPEDTARGLLYGVTGGLLGAISIFVITFYYLMEKDFTRSLLLMQFKPSTASRIRRTLDNVDQQLGRWMRGQLTLCFIIGITSTIAYGLLDVAGARIDRGDYRGDSNHRTVDRRGAGRGDGADSVVGESADGGRRRGGHPVHRELGSGPASHEGSGRVDAPDGLPRVTGRHGIHGNPWRVAGHSYRRGHPGHRFGIHSRPARGREHPDDLELAMARRPALPWSNHPSSKHRSSHGQPVQLALGREPHQRESLGDSEPSGA